MNVDYDETAKYFDGGGKSVWKDKFDYLLVRQDFNGFESIYFNIDEIEEVYQMISDGEIIIHHNYSILYGKNKDILDKILELGYAYPCYEAVWEERK